MTGKPLELRITNPRGFMVDAYCFTIGGERMEAPPPARTAGALQLQRDAATITIGGNGFC